jgi:glycosyltransferase involved in cell wall biosynthesis
MHQFTRRASCATTNPYRIDVAVLIPCYNEAATIRQVVGDFGRALPSATVYVYDNNSTDQTAQIARNAGAVVVREPLQGKGNVVRRMFADIEADVYVLIDGDATYDVSAAPALIEKMLDERLDFVNARRVETEIGAYRPGHRLGNRLLTGLVAWVFGDRLSDMLSGYKVLSRRFVKSFPALSAGFETETELAVHALELAMPIGEVATDYRERPPGSESKLNTFQDGFRILRLIAILIKEERPLAFFGGAFIVFVATSLLIGFPVVLEFLETGAVPRLPTAVLATGIALLGFLSLVCGLVLDTVTHGRRELKRLHYLAIPSLTAIKSLPADAAIEQVAAPALQNAAEGP